MASADDNRGAQPVNAPAHNAQDPQSECTAPPEALSGEFRTMFDAEFGYVCRSLRRLGVAGADLLDVAQELFITVHRRLGDYDRSRPVRPWLYSYSLKFAANYRRLARHRMRTHERDETPARASDPNAEARDIVLRALDDLDDEQRTVLVMHDLEGFGGPEIAELTGTLLNTVYSRLRLARASFRSAVARLQDERGTP